MQSSVSPQPPNEANGGSPQRSGGRPTIAAGLQSRYLDTIAKFQAKVRNMSTSIDSEEYARLAELRTTLKMSHTHCGELLDAARENLQAQKDLIAQSRQRFTERAVDEEVVLLDDVLHKDGYDCLPVRAERVENQRVEVLSLGIKLKDAHDERCSIVKDVNEWLASQEAVRKATIKQMLEQLLVDLSVIGYCSITESQLLVQRAALSCNEQMLINQTTRVELVSKLLQYDIFKQRECGEQIAALFHDVQHTQRDSMVLWTQQLLCNSAFRAPRSRIGLLLKVSQSLDKTKHEVANLLAGVGVLAGSLQQRRDPTRHPELPGGTAATGWLKYYQEDHDAPVFSRSLASIAREWRVAIEVILQHEQCLKAALLDDANMLERQLDDEMRKVCMILDKDLELLYSPTNIEQQMVIAMSLSETDVFPLHSIVRDDEDIKKAQEGATATLQPICEEIGEESKWFVETVNAQLTVQGAKFMNVLLAGPQNVVNTIHEATMALEAAATPPCLMIRDFFVKHFELRKDYDDQLRWYEEDYAKTEELIMHAGTVDEATIHCIKATEILSSIEKLYCTHHEAHVNGLPAFLSELDATYGGVAATLFAALEVIPITEVEERNARIDEQIREREKLLKPVGAGTGKGDKRGAAQQQQQQVSILPDDAPPLPEKIDAESLPQFTTKGGITFVALKPEIRYGKSESFEALQQQQQQQQQAAQQQQQQQAAGSSPQAKEKEQAKGKDDAKGGKGGKKGAAAAAAAAAAAKEEEEQAEAPPPKKQVSELFQKKMIAAMDPVFHDECLISSAAVPTLHSAMRENIVGWVLDLRTFGVTESQRFCNETKDGMDSESNDLIRKHQRRPTALQAQVYEQRVRELDDGQLNRTKYFTWLHQRVAQTKATGAAETEEADKELASDMQKLVRHREESVNVNAINALETHQRGFQHMIAKFQTSIGKRHEQILGHVNYAIKNMRNECDKFEAERLKSFEEGGTLAQAEKEACAQELASIRSDTDGVLQAIEEAANALQQRYKGLIAEEEKAYEGFFQHNVAELTYFMQMQEQFASLKGRVSNQIAVSHNAQDFLDETLAKLELLVGKPGAKPDATRVLSLINAVDYEAGGDPSNGEIKVVEDNKWEGDDQVLSAQLRRTKIDTEVRMKESQAMKILEVLDDLRKQLYTRGLYLACLQNSTDYQLLAPENFLEPKKDAAGGSGFGGAGGSGFADGASSSQQQQQAGGKDAKKDPKGQKPAKSGGGGPPKSAEGERPDKNPIRVIRAELQTSKWIAPCRDALTTLTTGYFQHHEAPLLRPKVLGADQAEVMETINTRMTEQEQRIRKHVVEGTTKYREQVLRGHLVIHRISAEAMNSLLNVTMDTLLARCVDVFKVFGAYYTSMVRAKHTHGTIVKGSMAAPSNRPQLEKIALNESYRQDKAKHFLRKYWGILLREVQEEALRCASATCHATATFFTMARSFVTPDHVIPGENVVLGHHKSLKRLMRQKVREDMGKQLEGGTLAPQGAAAEKDKKGAKKPEPKKKDDKPKGGKGGKGQEAKSEDDDYQQLPLLERQAQEYVGVQMNGVRCHEAFRRENPALKLVDHLLHPSQWAQKEAAEAEAASAATAATDGKKPQPKGAKPQQGKQAGASPSGAKGAQQQQQPGDPSASSQPFEEAEPIHYPVLAAPKDRLHQSAVLARTQSIENFNAVCRSFAGSIEERFVGLERTERMWAESWGESINALRTEVNKD